MAAFHEERGTIGQFPLAYRQEDLHGKRVVLESIIELHVRYKLSHVIEKTSAFANFRQSHKCYAIF